MRDLTLAGVTGTAFRMNMHPAEVITPNETSVYGIVCMGEVCKLHPAIGFHFHFIQ